MLHSIYIEQVNIRTKGKKRHRVKKVKTGIFLFVERQPIIYHLRGRSARPLANLSRSARTRNCLKPT